MKKIKTIFSILLIIVCIATVLTGCSNSSKGNEAKVEITLNDEQIKFEANAKNIINEYLALRLEVMEIGNSSKWESKGKISNKIDEIYNRFNSLDEAITLLDSASEEISLASISKNNSIHKKTFNSFGTTVYAAESTKEAVEWAEKITKAYDSYPTGKQIRGLAAYLGTDCKTAMKKLEVAQGIMSNEYENEAQMWEDLTDVAMTIQTTCKVELCVAGLATGNIESITDAGIAVLNGVDTLIAVGSSGAEIILGENDNVTVSINKLKDMIAPITSVTGILTFNSPDTSTADKIAYIGDSLTDLIFEGKILGITVTAKGDKQELTAETFDTLEDKKDEIKVITPETIEEIKNDSINERQEISVNISNVIEELKKINNEDTKQPEEKKKEDKKEDIKKIEIPGKYSISLKFLQAGTDSQDYGEANITIDGNKLNLQVTGEDEPVIFDFDEATLKGQCTQLNGQGTVEIEFDEKGHFTYIFTNNNDGNPYIEIDGTKIE